MQTPKLVPWAAGTVAVLLLGGPLAADGPAGPAQLVAAVYTAGADPPVRRVLGASVAGGAGEAVRAVVPWLLGAARGHGFAVLVHVAVLAVVAGSSNPAERAIFPERLWSCFPPRRMR